MLYKDQFIIIEYNLINQSNGYFHNFNRIIFGTILAKSLRIDNG